MFNKLIQITCVGIVFLAFTACCSSNKSNKGVISPAEDSLIGTYRNQPKENPPRKIYQYSYNGNKVFYVTAPCCDFYSDLLDSNCKVIGHPDGGITGKGDGKVPDFNTAKKDEKLVWEDKR